MWKTWHLIILSPNLSSIFAPSPLNIFTNIDTKQKIYFTFRPLCMDVIEVNRWPVREIGGGKTQSLNLSCQRLFKAL